MKSGVHRTAICFHALLGWDCVFYSVHKLHNFEENSALFIQCVYPKVNVRVSLEIACAEHKSDLSPTYDYTHKINNWITWLSVCYCSISIEADPTGLWVYLHFKYPCLLRSFMKWEYVCLSRSLSGNGVDAYFRWSDSACVRRVYGSSLSTVKYQLDINQGAIVLEVFLSRFRIKMVPFGVFLR